MGSFCSSCLENIFKFFQRKPDDQLNFSPNRSEDQTGYNFSPKRNDLSQTAGNISLSKRTLNGFDKYKKFKVFLFINFILKFLENFEVNTFSEMLWKRC